MEQKPRTKFPPWQGFELRPLHCNGRQSISSIPNGAVHVTIDAHLNSLSISIPPLSLTLKHMHSFYISLFLSLSLSASLSLSVCLSVCLSVAFWLFDLSPLRL